MSGRDALIAEASAPEFAARWASEAEHERFLEFLREQPADWPNLACALADFEL